MSHTTFNLTPPPPPHPPFFIKILVFEQHYSLVLTESPLKIICLSSLVAHSSRLGRAAKISLLKGDGPLSIKIPIVPCNGEIFETFIYQSYLRNKYGKHTS